MEKRVNTSQINNQRGYQPTSANNGYQPTKNPQPNPPKVPTPVPKK